MRTSELLKKLKICLNALDIETKERYKWVAQDNDKCWYLFEFEPIIIKSQLHWDVDYKKHPSEENLHKELDFEYSSSNWMEMKFKVENLITINNSVPSDLTIDELDNQLKINVNWLAMDQNGDWYYYFKEDEKPERLDSTWSNGNSYKLCSNNKLKHPYEGLWFNSLIDITYHRENKKKFQEIIQDVSGGNNINKAIELIERSRTRAISMHNEELKELDLALSSLRKLS